MLYEFLTSDFGQDCGLDLSAYYNKPVDQLTPGDRVWAKRWVPGPMGVRAKAEEVLVISQKAEYVRQAWPFHLEPPQWTVAVHILVPGVGPVEVTGTNRNQVVCTYGKFPWP